MTTPMGAATVLVLALLGAAGWLATPVQGWKWRWRNEQASDSDSVVTVAADNFAPFYRAVRTVLVRVPASPPPAVRHIVYGLPYGLHAPYGPYGVPYGLYSPPRPYDPYAPPGVGAALGPSTPTASGASHHAVTAAAVAAAVAKTIVESSAWQGPGTKVRNTVDHTPIDDYGRTDWSPHAKGGSGSAVSAASWAQAGVKAEVGAGGTWG